MNAFVHLNIHTEYSLSDGIIRIPALIKAALNRNLPAVAITDHHNLFAAIKFYKSAIAAGIKPIFGVDVCLQNPTKKIAEPITLLCQNNRGYKNLLRLLTVAYTHNRKEGKLLITADDLQTAQEGLLLVLGSASTPGKALIQSQLEMAQDFLRHWSLIFKDRLYLTVERIGKAYEENYIENVLKMAENLSLPVAVSNAVRFLNKEDYMAHEARVCIHQGVTIADPNRPKIYTPQQYLRSSEEMRACFADLPAALANTLEIAKRCNVDIEIGKVYLPHFPLPTGYTNEDYLAEKAQAGLHQRKPFILKNRQVTTPQQISELDKTYVERLQIEVNVINRMGFAGYFLIVADFIQWTKQQNIPVGPGRGSGAGSLVAYALGITDIDPLQFDLLFERFLNPERVSMPDFDIDFCMEGRDRVIEYVTQKYGRQSVAQIITFGAMAAKAVIRDVGRALAHPYGFVDKIAKLIPFEIGITLEKALAQEEELQSRYEREEEVKSLIDLARTLEGITRNAGKHAGGVVIAPTALTDFSPLYCEADANESHWVTQYDKDDIEAVGLVKFDFLGLRTLTIIDWTLNFIRDSTQQTIELQHIPIDDVATFALLQACKTTAVFQLESRGMKDLVKRLQPDCFDDVMALVALFRPGPLQSGMVDDFIDRKHGRAAVDYPHPALEPVLKSTYGVILYQEQVMQIAQVLAGYSLGGADLLRKAMGKKNVEDMAKQRQIFTEGAKQQGVDPKKATYIFDLMEKFAGYGFNKSHSAAYAWLSYQTAWLKAHYPAYFMAAVLSSDLDNTDKIALMINECRDLGIKVLPPHILQSRVLFTVLDEKTILYSLAAIKGVGETAVEHIESLREKYEIKDLYDLCYHADLKRLNRRVLEALIKAGALDHFGEERAELFANLEEALQMAEQAADDRASGQLDLFSAPTKTSLSKHQEKSSNKSPIAPWTLVLRLQGEKETLGFYFSGHPTTAYREEFSSLVTGTIGQLELGKHSKVLILGLVANYKKIFTKKQKRMAVLELEDENQRLEVVLFSESYAAFKERIVEGEIVVVRGELSRDNVSNNLRVLVEDLWDLKAARERFLKTLTLVVNKDFCSIENLKNLKVLLKTSPGNTEVQFVYEHPIIHANLSVDREWYINPTNEVLENLKNFLGKEKVKLKY